MKRISPAVSGFSRVAVLLFGLVCMPLASVPVRAQERPHETGAGAELVRVEAHSEGATERLLLFFSAGYDPAQVRQMHQGANIIELFFPAMRIRPHKIVLAGLACLQDSDFREEDEAQPGLRLRLQIRAECRAVVRRAPDRIEIRMERLVQQTTMPVYRLGVGDVLEVQVGAQPALNTRATISAEGTLTLPLVGIVPAAGKTVAELERELNRRFESFLALPEVRVRIVEYRSQWVVVEGAVRKPGRYYLRGPTQLADILREAGGTTTAAADRVVIKRRVDGTVKTLEVSRSAATAWNPVWLQHGDRIRVPEKQFYYVDGEVVRPGPYTWFEGLTLREALERAGGLRETAAPTILVFRQTQGAPQTLQYSMEEVMGEAARAIPVLPNDVIRVPRGRIRREEKPPGV